MIGGAPALSNDVMFIAKVQWPGVGLTDYALIALGMKFQEESKITIT